MSNDMEVRQQLLDRIRARRASVDAFVREMEPRAVRLTNLSILSSGVATALTAAPALGGERFTTGIQQLFGLAESSLVWRGLCLAAAFLSIAAAIFSNMYKSNNLAERLSKAQAGNAKLAGLETLVELGQIPVAEAVRLYQEYIGEVAFIPD